MRRRAMLFLLALAPAMEAADLAEVRESGVLRVIAVEGSSAFLQTRPGGSLAGLDGEILTGFARLQDLELEVVLVESWSDLVPALEARRGDVLAGGVTASASRRERIDFTAEIFPSRYVVLSRLPVEVVRSVEALRGLRVATVPGTSLAEQVSALGVPEESIVLVESGGLPDALRSGAADACVIGLEDAILARRDDSDMRLGLAIGDLQSLALGVRREDPDLRDALDEYLLNLRRGGSWNRLVVKYFGDAALEILRETREAATPH